MAANWREWLPKTLLLVAVAVAAFWPAFSGDFLWDDAKNITGNSNIHDPLGVSKILTQNDAFGEYYPMTTLVEWTLWQIFGQNTLAFHLTTFVLHMVNAMLLWALFTRLRLPFAGLGALIFAIHPITVESVAWITELKNTISLGPLLVAMLLLLQWEEKQDVRSYRWAVACFGLSLLAKSSGIMLPVVMLGYAWWRRGSITRLDLKSAVSFFGLAALDAVIIFWPKDAVNLPQLGWNPASALAAIGWTLFFILGKCAVPFHLLPVYPGFYGKPVSLLDLLPWASLAIMGVLLWRARATWGRHVLFGLGFFLVNLVPVFIYMFLHYTRMIWSLDHLAYLSLIGLIGLFIAWLGMLQQRLGPSRRMAGGIGLAAVVMLLGWETYAYSEWWVDPNEFWRLALNSNPGSSLIREANGVVLESEGREDEALEQYAYALQIDPQSSDVLNDMGAALQKLGRTDEAEQAYRRSTEVNPHDATAYIRLGEMLETAGRKSEAAAEYGGAVKLVPDSPQLRYNLGTLYLTTGNLPGAIEQLQEAVELDPDLAPARHNYGSALAQAGRLPEAIDQLEAAISLKPSDVIARNNLARALAQTGRIDDAIAQLQQVLILDPGDAQAQQNLARLQQYELQHPDAGGPK